MAAPRRLFQSCTLRSFTSETRYLLKTRNASPNPLYALAFQSQCLSKPQVPAHFQSCRRYNSTSTRPPKPLTDSKPATPEEEAYNEARRAEEPSYLITFTCKPCSHRSGHRISKHGYHKGTVLIMCPNCRNKHVISDHLGIFMDKKSTLEDILATKGQSLKKVTLGEGDLELWPESASETNSEAPIISKPKS